MMNPVLKRLGFGPEDRVVIIHADDIGVCHAANAAFADLFEFGLVSSGAAIVPGPWFPEAAAFCRANPTVDMGVHLAVNAEFTPCRWGPMSTRDPSTGLIDEQGYFHRSPRAVMQQADPGAVASEIRAQLARALQEGIDVTHLDAHMLTVALPPFLESYLALALENRLPMLFPSVDLIAQGARELPPEILARYRQRGRELEEQGMPMFDAIAFLPLGLEPHGVDAAKRVIDGLRPGLTMLILHPAQDTPELRAMTPDWRSRASNYQTCMSTGLRDHVRDSGVQVIGYRALRDLLRGES